MAVKIKEINIQITIEKNIVNSEQTFIKNITQLHIDQLPKPLLEEIFEYYQKRKNLYKYRYKELKDF